MARTYFEALIGSRICHDLISPVGAITNGLELIGETGAGMPEMALITQSAAAARARLMYFRLAFGASAPDARIGTAEFTRVVADMFSDGRVRMNTDTAGSHWPAALDRRSARLLALLLLCVEHALPLGGLLALDTAPDGTWTIRANGRRVTPQSGLWAHLLAGDSAPDPTAADIQFPLARRLATTLNVALHHKAGDTWLDLATGPLPAPEPEVISGPASG